MQILAYASDVIVGKYEIAVKDAFNTLEMETKMGLINYAKQNMW